MNIIKKLIDYIHSSKNELSKVTWPSKDETIRYSSLVIIISLGAIAFFGILDYGLNKIVSATLSNVQINNNSIEANTTQAPINLENNLIATTTPNIQTTTVSSTDKK